MQQYFALSESIGAAIGNLKFAGEQYLKLSYYHAQVSAPSALEKADSFRAE